MKTETWLGQIRGIVEIVEQKSGINPLLFLTAIVALPSLILYAFTSKTAFLVFATIPLAAVIIFYTLAFFIDRNFLRSEKHQREMRRMDMLGEKGKEVDEAAILEETSTVNPTLLDIKKRMDDE